MADYLFGVMMNSEASLYRGNFIEFLKLFAQINEEIGKYILSNASKNCQMTAPSIQKDICNCFAEEVLKMIFEELGDDVFSLLVDELRDISKKEQMVVVLRFVDKLGFVKERYIGVVHVMETTALSLKSAIDELFAHRNLCVALQRKNQDILNAVELVRSTKEELQRYRLEGLDSLLKDVTSFCDKYDIEMINMEDEYVDPKNRRRKTNITNRHHFVVNNFNTVLDMQIQELGNLFNEVTTNLLTCMSTLSPRDNFSSFNKLNLLKLAEMYPYDFTFDEKDKLIDELGHYISNMKKDSRFDNLNGVSDLAKRMVETRKHIE
ncbi:uncharacterized protein LOC110914386 [Helianthus annuus]|uniref:uncharacterized protein LOC110914386 n=1 Tax=Helianthus annuus TaxID=4232 RepID=UPI000B8EEACB|nr:uncharacterized protein LOC110914386 [Helianthus annuus]